MRHILLFSVIALFCFLGVDCKDKPPIVPPDDKPDTTSHNFTFTTYTFGGSGGSSYFKDVAIINDSDIWAVGQIYTDSSTYNAAHWNGKKWELKKIFSAIFGGGEGLATINTVFAFNANDIWMFSSAGSYIQWNGQQWTTKFVSERSGGGDKIWGTSSQNLYIVGTNGSIAHFNGSMWTKQTSGTTIDLRDVWGSADGKTVWACGESNDYGKSILLEKRNTNWRKVYEYTFPSSPLIPSKDSIRAQVTSVWSKSNTHYIVAGYGIYTVPLYSNGESRLMMEINDIDNYVTGTLHSVRGNAHNDFFAVGQFGTVIHYNGTTWHHYQELYDATGDTKYFSVSMKDDLVVAVGSISSAIITIGRR